MESRNSALIKASVIQWDVALLGVSSRRKLLGLSAGRECSIVLSLSFFGLLTPPKKPIPGLWPFSQPPPTSLILEGRFSVTCSCWTTPFLKHTDSNYMSFCHPASLRCVALAEGFGSFYLEKIKDGTDKNWTKDKLTVSVLLWKHLLLWVFLRITSAFWELEEGSSRIKLFVSESSDVIYSIVISVYSQVIKDSQTEHLVLNRTVMFDSWLTCFSFGRATFCNNSAQKTSVNCLE